MACARFLAQAQFFILYEAIVSKVLNFPGGAVASWLVHLSPDRVVRVRALAGDIVLCSHPIQVRVERRWEKKYS